MKTLLKYFEEIGYIIERSYYYESTKVGNIFCKKVDGNVTIMITVHKNYKGYQVEKAEFIGDNIGRVRKKETTTIKEVKEFCS